MASLQRSAVSFRRQGSSGVVWDEKLLSAGESAEEDYRELRPCQSAGTIGMMERIGSINNAASVKCKRSWSGPPMNHQPSIPKMFGCGFITGAFEKSKSTKSSKP